MSENKTQLEALERSATEDELEAAVNELTEKELDDLAEVLDDELIEESVEESKEQVSEEVERKSEVSESFKADLFDVVPSLPSKQPKLARKEMLRSMREKMSVKCAEMEDDELEEVYQFWMLPDWCMMPSRASTVANTSATQKESLGDPAYNAEEKNKKSKVLQSPVLSEVMTPDVPKQKLDDSYQVQQLSSEMETEEVEEVDFPSPKIKTPNAKVVRSEEEVERNNENLTKVIEDNTQNENQSEEESEMDMDALKEILRSVVQESVNPLNEKMDALKVENEKLKAELELVRNQPVSSPVNLVNGNGNSGDPAKANHEVIRSKFEKLIKGQNPNAAVALLMASGLRDEMRKRNKENN